MHKILFFILLLLHLNPFSFQGTDTLVQQQKSGEVDQLAPLEFREEKLQKFREDPAYDYSEDVEEENWWTRFKRYIGLQWEKFLNRLFGDLQSSGFWAKFLQLLPYIILMMSLGLMLFLFIKLNPATSVLSPSKKAQLILKEEEDIISSKNIRELIDSAVKKEDYRLAVRYHFLYILQQLTEKGIIIYNSSKTDEDYINEISREDHKEHFKKLSRIYDFIWYGHFDPDLKLYQKIKLAFQELEALIKPNYEHHL